jgi:HEPN domain-containing protein
MERSADWMDQAEGDLEHARNDLRGGFYPPTQKTTACGRG